MASNTNMMHDEERYEVFLNFRGDDTRQIMVDVLHGCMKDIGVHVFRDSEGLHTGDHIHDLFRHIEACTIFVAVFSENYAQSKWCLDELAHAVRLEKDSEGGRRIMPIFCKVTPRNVKLKEAGYREVLASKIEEHGQQKVEEWVEALKYVGRISGKPWRGEGIMSFAKPIAKEILSMLKQPIVPHWLDVTGDQVEMREMESGKAREYFCWHALGRSSPQGEDYAGLAWDAVSLMGSLPLGLGILGSFLHRKPANEWDETITKIKGSNCESAFQKMLEIVYDSLSVNAKKVFLDIACFFVNKEKTNPTYMWTGSRLINGIEALLNLSLIKVTEDNKLWMHNQVRDFGRQKVHQECTNYIERSRFWEHDKALEVLKSTEGGIRRLQTAQISPTVLGKLRRGPQLSPSRLDMAFLASLPTFSACNRLTLIKNP